MRRIFIRALWGTPKTDYDVGWIAPSKNRHKMNGDIALILQNKYTSPFVTYVFGEDNYNYLKSLHIDNCVLIDKRPFVYNLQTEFWRHKFDILKYSMEVDKYDEIVYLDWDCFPIKSMDDNFWNLLSKKREIQSNLQWYRRRKCLWRGATNTRKVSNGGFIYIRDNKIPQAFIDIWQKLDPSLRFWDEIAISKFIDELMGEWIGEEKYFTEFEPDVCNLKKRSMFENKSSENTYFIHYIQSHNNKQAKMEAIK